MNTGKNTSVINILFAIDYSKGETGYISKLIEIVESLENVKVITGLSKFWKKTEGIDLVIINWPDYLFNWKKKITDQEILKLTETLKFYQSKGTKLLTVVHDEYAHHTRNKNRDLIFDICYSNSDILAHLGDYSLKKYTEKYFRLGIKNVLLYHPLFNYKFDKLDQGLLKKQYSLVGKNVVLVPGNIRNFNELKLVLKTFRNIVDTNKYLIIQRIGFNRGNLGFCNKLWYNFFLKFHSNKILIVGTSPVDQSKLVELFTLSDIVLLSRFNILNSGNLILANQFNKRIIGFETGNITEWLKFSNDYVLDKNNLKQMRLTKGDLICNKSKFLDKINDDSIREQFYQILTYLNL